MTQLEADQIVNNAERCTEATLQAFGIYGIVPKLVTGCLRVLMEKGFKTWEDQNFRDRPLIHLLNNPRGCNYLIITEGHAMAFVDGILINTAVLDFYKVRIKHCWLVLKETA